LLIRWEVERAVGFFPLIILLPTAQNLFTKY